MLRRVFNQLVFVSIIACGTEGYGMAPGVAAAKSILLDPSKPSPLTILKLLQQMNAHAPLAHPATIAAITSSSYCESDGKIGKRKAVKRRVGIGKDGKIAVLPVAGRVDKPCDLQLPPSAATAADSSSFSLEVRADAVLEDLWVQRCALLENIPQEVAQVFSGCDSIYAPITLTRALVRRFCEDQNLLPLGETVLVVWVSKEDALALEDLLPLFKNLKMCKKK